MTNPANTSAEPRLEHVQCISPSGLHRMAYWEWGQPDNARVVVCVHGLSRQGRDFDVLARALSSEFRVVCPDVVGRGESGRLANPAGYQNLQYIADMVTLMARIDASEIYWVGTSMGGLIGMGLASLPDNPIRRLVLNDVGPTLNAEALNRIGSYLGKAPTFTTEDEAADYLQGISRGFGPHTREEWMALSRPMLRSATLPDGQAGVALHYDPKIALPFASFSAEALEAGQRMLWAAYDAIRVPTLLLRGAESDLLSAATAEQMTQRGPRARLVEWPGVGHAPTLTAPEQVAVVQEFLRSP